MAPDSISKAEKAAALEWGGQFGSPVANFNSFAIEWQRPFDCYCYILAARKAKYGIWLSKLMPATGWSEEALLAHGDKIHRLLHALWSTYEVNPRVPIRLFLHACALNPD